MQLVQTSRDSKPTDDQFGVFQRDGRDGRHSVFANNARGERIASVEVSTEQLDDVARALWELLDATHAKPALALVR